MLQSDSTAMRRHLVRDKKFNRPKKEQPVCGSLQRVKKRLLRLDRNRSLLVGAWLSLCVLTIFIMITL